MADIKITEDNTEEVLAQLELATQKALTIIGMKAEKYAKALCQIRGSIFRPLFNNVQTMVDICVFEGV